MAADAVHSIHQLDRIRISATTDDLEHIVHDQRDPGWLDNRSRPEDEMQGSSGTTQSLGSGYPLGALHANGKPESVLIPEPALQGLSGESVLHSGLTALY